MTDEETIARLKAACERIRLLGKPGPRPAYDPGAPSIPKPPADAPKPPASHHDREPGQDEEDEA